MPRRVGEIAALALKLLFGAIAKRFYVAEHETDPGMALEGGLYGSVVSFGHNIVVVKEMDVGSASVRPTQIADNAGDAPRCWSVAEIGDAWILELLHHLPRRSVGTIVDHQYVECHPGLTKYAGQCLCQLYVPAKRRDDHRYVRRHMISPSSLADLGNAPTKRTWGGTGNSWIHGNVRQIPSRTSSQ